jgi:hypothetical protein
VTLPLIGSLLTKFNALPCVPLEEPLGDLLNSLAVRTAFKSADETVVSSTVLQADDQLFVDVVAGARYQFQAILFFSVPADGIKVSLNGTCTVGGLKAQVEIYDTVLRQSGRITALGGSVAHGTGGGGDHYVTIQGSVEVGDAGTLGIWWAQATSNIVGLTLQRDSSLVLVPLT